MEAAGRRDDLAVINPHVVLGPLLGDDPGVSAALVKRLLDGSLPVAARVYIGIVDVRDVAALHLAAMEIAGGGRAPVSRLGGQPLADGGCRGPEAGFPAVRAENAEIRAARLVHPRCSAGSTRTCAPT